MPPPFYKSAGMASTHAMHGLNEIQKETPQTQ
jgi:hypothetical protein